MNPSRERLFWPNLLFLLWGCALPAWSAPEEEALPLGLLDAVELALANDPRIALVESRLTASRGARIAAEGRFDPTLLASVDQDDLDLPQGEDAASESSALRGSVSLTQELRTGLTLTPALDLSRDDNGGPAVNTSTVSFTLRQPLLRGRGREIVGADVEAALREVEAARLDLEFTVSQRLLAVVFEYWNVKAALADLEVLRATEASSREILGTTRRLVDADVTPAAEIVQLEADLASREANRIAGEQALFRARQDLGREIGLEPLRIAELALPGDPFPTVDPGDVPPPHSAAWIAEALARRADLAAARERLAATESRLRAAGNALRPRLDFVVTPSYSGLTVGGGAGELFAPIVDNVPGLSTSFGVNLSWPTFNRGAEGALIQAEAARDQDSLDVELAAKMIGADVPTALDAVRRNASRLERIDEAVGFFEQALDNEIKKLRAGTSTLVDVITQRDRLTAIQRQQVAARLTLARALAELRFQTGTLFKAADDGFPRRGTNERLPAVGQGDLTTLPPF